jgi:hypothetical protein
MNDPHVPARGAGGPATSTRREIDSFVEAARTVAPIQGRARLVFALDATMSRQPTWDRACRLQADMFHEAAALGGLQVQLVYFRGYSECRAGRWTEDAGALANLMSGIECRGGHTQIGRVLGHVRSAAGKERVHAVVFVGDAMEEALDDVAGRAGELALLGIPAFMFQEGRDVVAEHAFREIARVTRGAYARFDASAAGELGRLLRAAAAFAAGGREGLERLARAEPSARLMLQQMR